MGCLEMCEDEHKYRKQHLPAPSANNHNARKKQRRYEERMRQQAAAEDGLLSTDHVEKSTVEPSRAQLRVTVEGCKVPDIQPEVVVDVVSCSPSAEEIAMPVCSIELPTGQPIMQPGCVPFVTMKFLRDLYSRKCDPKNEAPPGGYGRGFRPVPPEHFPRGVGAFQLSERTVALAELKTPGGNDSPPELEFDTSD